MKVFSIIDNKLASWEVDTDDFDMAILTVRQELGATHRKPILALVPDKDVAVAIDYCI